MRVSSSGNGTPGCAPATRSTARLRAAWKPEAKPASGELLENADLSAGTAGWTFESAGVPTRGEVVPVEGGGRAIRFAADRRRDRELAPAALPRAPAARRGGALPHRVPRPGAPGRAGRRAAGAQPRSHRDAVGPRLAQHRPRPHNRAFARVEAGRARSFRPQGTIAGEGRLNFSLRNVPGVVEIADLTLRAGPRPSSFRRGRRRGRNHSARARRGRLAVGRRFSPLPRRHRSAYRGHARRVTSARRSASSRCWLTRRRATAGSRGCGARSRSGLRRHARLLAAPGLPGAGLGPAQLADPNTTQACGPNGGGAPRWPATAWRASHSRSASTTTRRRTTTGPRPADVAAFAAFQDWDAIYAYTYLDFSPRWDADHLLGFFDLAGNPAALSFLPIAALTLQAGADRALGRGSSASRYRRRTRPRRRSPARARSPASGPRPGCGSRSSAAAGLKSSPPGAVRRRHRAGPTSRQRSFTGTSRRRPRSSSRRRRCAPPRASSRTGHSIPGTCA